MGGWNLETRDIENQSREFDSNQEISNCIDTISWMSTQDVQSVVENLAANDNEFNSRLCEFQDINSLLLNQSLLGINITQEFSLIEEMFDKNENERFDEIEQHEKIQIESFYENAWSMIENYEKWVEQLRNSNISQEKIIQYQNYINNIKQKYIKIVVWIGDKYEWAAFALKDKDSLSKSLQILPWLLSSLSPEQAMDFLINIHADIDENNRQSDSVKENYWAFTKQLHKNLQSKFEKLPIEERKIHLLSLTKTITWRNWNTDRRYREPWLANNILISLLDDKWWVFETILEKEKMEIVDEKVTDSPINIYNRFNNVKIWEQNFLDIIWFDDLWNMWEWASDYVNLSPEQKIKISTLSRIEQKLKENPNLDVVKALQEIAVDTAVELYEPLNDELWHDWHDIVSKNSDNYGIEWIDKEIFDLYQDINGSGLFDLADTTWNGLWEAGKIWAVIAASIAAWVAMAPVVAAMWVWLVAWAVITWIAVWVTSVAASQMVYQNWYDTTWEAVTDIWTDLAFSTITWAVGWAATAKFMSYGTRSFFSGWALRNAWLALGDWALWMWAEVARQELILWKDASFVDMLKHGWPMLAFWMLMWAKAPNTRAELEMQTRKFGDAIEYSKNQINSLKSALEVPGISDNKRILIQKEIWEWETASNNLKTKMKWEKDSSNGKNNNDNSSDSGNNSSNDKNNNDSSSDSDNNSSNDKVNNDNDWNDSSNEWTQGNKSEQNETNDNVNWNTWKQEDLDSYIMKYFSESNKETQKNKENFFENINDVINRLGERFSEKIVNLEGENFTKEWRLDQGFEFQNMPNFKDISFNESESFYKNSIIREMRETDEIKVSIMEEVVSKNPWATFENAPSLKWEFDASRSIAKIIDDYEWDPSKLLDISRASILHKRLDWVYSVFDGILRHHNVENVFVKNRFNRPNWYRDMNLSIKARWWRVFESQIHVESLSKAKKQWMKIWKDFIEEKFNNLEESIKIYWKSIERLYNGSEVFNQRDIDITEKINLYLAKDSNEHNFISLPKNGEIVVWDKIYTLRRALDNVLSAENNPNGVVPKRLEWITMKEIVDYTYTLDWYENLLYDYAYSKVK